METVRVKIAFHARFDEGMNDLPHDAIPPNVQHLQRVQHGAPLPPESEEISAPPFGFISRMLLFVSTATMTLFDCVFTPTLLPNESMSPTLKPIPAPQPSAVLTV